MHMKIRKFHPGSVFTYIAFAILGARHISNSKHSASDFKSKSSIHQLLLHSGYLFTHDGIECFNDMPQALARDQPLGGIQNRRSTTSLRPFGGT